jgi:hypothetical protein
MNNTEQNEVILISLGNHQSYIIDNIKNLQLLNNNNITVITEPIFFEYYKDLNNINLVNTQDIDDTNHFETSNKLEPTFRNGFWRYASKRIFYLYYYMKKYNKRNCFHIENDVMIYRNLTTLNINSDKIIITLDNFERCIPGIMFISSSNILELIINNWDHQSDDMVNIGKAYNTHRDLFDTFPIIKKNSLYYENNIFTDNFEKYDSIFDAAAIGQYLGGIDPRNLPGDTTGFINTHCKINYSVYSFYWKKSLENNIYLPYVLIDNKLIAINNLHIHSKQLLNFVSCNPNIIENKYIKIYNNVIV